MPLGKEIGLGPGQIMLDGDPAPTAAPPHFSIVDKRCPISATAELLYKRSLNNWNSLPNHVVLSDTVNMFKSRLDKFWQHQDLIYDFKAEISGTGSRSCY